MPPSFFRLLAPGLLLLVTSCAYVQTHKNVEERERSYRGHHLTTPTAVYSRGGQWYLAALPADFRKHYPTVHDTVFQGQEEAHMRLVGKSGNTPAYQRISEGTARVLMREDGYAELQTLADELRSSPGEWKSSLPGAKAHPVRAQLVGEPAAIIPPTEKTELSFGTRALSSLAFTFVDVPGTVLYNVAIPLAAPVVFFRDFLSED